MSPRLRKTEWSIPEANGRGGNIKVSTTDDKRVIVTWFCGATRTFTPEDLADRIDNVERVKVLPNTWVDDTDSQGHRYGATVTDGTFQANDGPADGRTVSWDTLLDALKNALHAVA